jgi:putative transposase
MAAVQLRIESAAQQKHKLEEKKQEEKKAKLKKSAVTKAPAAKARKIRLYPNKAEREKLLKWFGTARWTYNECIKAMEHYGIPNKKKELRAHTLNEEAFVLDQWAWVKETPYDIRDEAMNDCHKACKTNKMRVKTGGIKRFRMQYRTRKDPTQSIVIHGKHWNHTRGNYSFLHAIYASEPLPTKLDYDCRLQLTALGEFYICIPMPLAIRPENQGPIGNSKRMIALDPGIRTFVTGYDPSGLAMEWGKNDIGRIYRLCYAVDDLQSRWTSDPNVRHHRRWKMKRAAMRLRKRIRSLVDEFHRKLAKWLCESYHLVLLPTFEVSKMMPRGQRRIGSKTARAMATWSHARFRQRLLDKVREYPWCNVVLVNEAYTSKTCGACGQLHPSLGGSKHFHCQFCGFDIGRDYNGARNIYLRYMSESRLCGAGSR